MRLTPHEAAAIRHVAAEVAGVHARVKLVGSRTRDDLRGGDIDLLIELVEPATDKLSVSLLAGARLQMAIGECKIDVLVTDPQSFETPLIRAARLEGIALYAAQAQGARRPVTG